jgi:thermostable 8-oxoguanine DNA glycosylase
MSYYEKSNQGLEGSTESPNLTVSQKKYSEILTILDKIANQVGLRRGIFWVEAPNGLERMMDAIKVDRKNIDTMNKGELEDYEKKYRYERITGQRLGNSALILQYILHMAHEDPEIQKIAKEFIAEAKMIASKTSSEYFDKKKDAD